MPLLFVGIDPATEKDKSPTLWVDQEKKELVIQGWKPSPELKAECAAFELPGHAKGIPDDEAGPCRGDPGPGRSHIIHSGAPS
ncbi:hypothetical protein SANTM175S_00738 [Streptomyces antimycoticus]